MTTPTACPSNHWNDGNDICADCGADLSLPSKPAPQHTPGPWRVRHVHQYNRYEVRGPGDTFTGQPGGSWICGDANEANAHLIAAAPELLAALIDFQRYHVMGEGSLGLAVDNARLAIAKAKGGAA